jgi:hypothetical protein
MRSGSDLGTRFAPTTRYAVVSFLIGGPLLYIPVFMAFQGDVIHAPIYAGVGFLMWFAFFFSADGWLGSWIPTVAAGVICACCLRALARSGQYARRGRGVKLLISGMLCGLISGGVYYLCLQVATFIHPPPPGNAQTVAGETLTQLYPIGIRLTSLGGGVLVVIVVGSILGTWLAWRADVFNAPVVTRRT